MKIDTYLFQQKWIIKSQQSQQLTEEAGTSSQPICGSINWGTRGGRGGGNKLGGADIVETELGDGARRQLLLKDLDLEGRTLLLVARSCWLVVVMILIWGVLGVREVEVKLKGLMAGLLLLLLLKSIPSITLVVMRLLVVSRAPGEVWNSGYELLRSMEADMEGFGRIFLAGSGGGISEVDRAWRETCRLPKWREGRGTLGTKLGLERWCLGG